jgi:hypothetical protein
VLPLLLLPLLLLPLLPPPPPLLLLLLLQEKALGLSLCHTSMQGHDTWHYACPV